jgi:putative MATE family efflux protein
MADNSDLNAGPVWRQLARMSAPMAVGILGVLAVGLADAWFLARAGETELAAIGFVYPVIVAISALSIGLSAGANTALSQVKGEGATADPVRRMTYHACAVGLLAALPVAALFWLGAPWLFAILGAEGAVLENVLAYTPWWAASFPILVLTMVLNSAFRANGMSVSAASGMVLTAVLNIALSPLLIFGTGPFPELGMAGAGIGTLVARALALGYVLALAYWRDVIGRVENVTEGVRASVRRIVSVGLPAAGSRAINPAGMAIVTAAVATIGESAVAGFGAAARVQSIALVPFFALSSGLSPVVGQAWGAGDAARARGALRAAAIFCAGYGAALGLGLFFFADWLGTAMTTRDTSSGYTADYLRIVGWSLVGYGLVVTTNAALTARSRAGWAMALSLGRIGLIYIPLAWVGVWLFGYAGILGAAVLANIGALWGALVFGRANEIGPLDVAGIRGPAGRLEAARGNHAKARSVAGE